MTALLSLDQVATVAEALAPSPGAIVSVFAGRIADTGRDPVPLMRDALGILARNPALELLWASPREILNVVQADEIGCHIITVTHDALGEAGRPRARTSTRCPSTRSGCSTTTPAIRASSCEDGPQGAGRTVIITRTPLRITLGGGGTDLPSYYEEFGGFVISAAINRYIYIAINQTFTPGYFLKYSAIEQVQNDRRHRAPAHSRVPPAARRGLGIELVSVADIPAGTGLGSSGAFTVGLLRAIHALTAAT